MKGPLVSVLMTAYNREKYIAQAIQSVLDSTYSNFELIIVDDNSGDNTMQIIKRFADSDQRIRFYQNTTNLGDYPNRNLAASYALGKYIKYVDSDDYIYPDGLAQMVNSMEKFPDAGLGLCSLKSDKEKPFPFRLEPTEAYRYHFFGPGLFHNGPLAAIFVTSAFREMKGFSAQRMISDTDMWHSMALKYPVVLLGDGIVWQRRHAEQELSFQKDFIYDGEKIKWKYLLTNNCKLSYSELKAIKKQRLKRYVTFILAGLWSLNFRQVKTYLKCAWFVFGISLKKH